ncbi:hypothetical protein G6F24_013055 [Rhizopus arrhizus]|nr:hypothetical protein G6F24_013055 [Rhizopus arrhizus]
MQAETHKRTQTKTDPGGKTFVGVRVHDQSPGSQREASCYHLYAKKDDLASLMAYYATSYLPTGVPHGNAKRRPSRSAGAGYQRAGGDRPLSESQRSHPGRIAPAAATGSPE